jgi:hypothetical protein
MKIKLLTDCPIRGRAKQAGDIVEVESETFALGDDKIGLRCMEWLIEQGKAELVEEKSKKSKSSE